MDMEQVKKRRTNYSYIPEDVKKKVVDYANKHGTRPTARFFNISEGTIRSWKLRGFDKHTPVITRGRKVTYGQDLDDELHLGLIALINEQQIITVDQFTEYAKKIIDERRPELNFKCSRGWIDKFLNRHNLMVTRSDAHKLMHIVEKEEIQLFRKSSSVSSTPSQQQQPHVQDESSHESGTNENSMEVTSGPVGFVVVGHEINTSASPPETTPTPQQQPEDGWNGQNGNLLASPTTPQKYSKTAAGYNSYLEGGVVNRSLSEKEQRKQKEIAKSMHVMDIVEKLDIISNSGGTSNTAGLDPQTRAEVVKHARQHGVGSAERKYGIPESTIGHWVKKVGSGPISEHNNVAIAQLPSMNHNNHTGPGVHAMAINHTPVHRDLASPGGSVMVSGVRRGGEIEANILAWALERRLNGEAVTFDGLCDQALAFVSQENPGSAYSSTRKWVDQFLNMKLKDVLTVQN